MNSFRIELKQSLLSNWRSCLAVFLLLCGLLLEYYVWRRLVYGCCHPEIAVGMLQIVVAFFMAFVTFAIVIDRFVRVKPPGRWVTRLGNLCLYYLALLASYFLLPHESRVVFVGAGVDGVVSSSTSDSVVLFLSFSTAFLFALSCFEFCVHIIHTCSVGIFATVAILMPTMLDKYDLLQAGLHNRSDLQFEWIIEEYNLIFSMVLAYMVSYAVFVLRLQNRAVRGERMNGVDNLTMPVWPGGESVVVSTSVEPSSASHGVASERVLPMWSADDLTNSSATAGASGVPHRSADHAAMPSRLEEARSSSSVSVGSSSGFRRVAVSRQLMGVAVSGLVAGACFSVVNRLFSRR